MSSTTVRETCKHCGRPIEKVDGRWIDPEATGDDSVWRESCDAHDTFQAEHEPAVKPVYTQTDGPGQLPEGPLPDGHIALTLEIENTYEDGDEITTWYTVVIPAPPVPLTQPDAREHPDYGDNWEYVHIFERTGTGRSKGDAWYDVTVLASSDPDQVPVGETFEFGY